jgi:hypothetical protein
LYDFVTFYKIKFNTGKLSVMNEPNMLNVFTWSEVAAAGLQSLTFSLKTMRFSKKFSSSFKKKIL